MLGRVALSCYVISCYCVVLCCAVLCGSVWFGVVLCYVTYCNGTIKSESQLSLNAQNIYRITEEERQG